MLQGYTHSQALRLYRKHKVRVAVPLSPLAMRKAAQRATTRAGLSELALVAHPSMVRGTFQSETEFQMELLAMRAAVHAATVHTELHA
jgi:hypothetical protein